MGDKTECEHEALQCSVTADISVAERGMDQILRLQFAVNMEHMLYFAIGEGPVICRQRWQIDIRDNSQPLMQCRSLGGGPGDSPPPPSGSAIPAGPRSGCKVGASIKILARVKDRIPYHA